MRYLLIIAFFAILLILALSHSSVAVPFDPDPHVNAVNTDNAAGVSTSMNGNNSTESGGSISSTSASKESRSVTGSGD